MKTTIEINGYEIVIESTEESVSVSASRDGETVEEFTIETEGGEEEMKAFGEEGEEEGDFDELDQEELDVDSDDDMDSELSDDDDDDDDDDFEEEGKMESFNTFIKKRK